MSANVGLLFKALLKKADKPRLSNFKPPVLSDIKPLTAMVNIVPEHWRAYAQCTGWLVKEGGADQLHPCYLQTLSLNLQLQLLTANTSPFPSMGLVHVGNHIRQLPDLNPNDAIQLDCHYGEVTEHPKGWQFEVIVTGTQNGKLRYTAVGLYFCRWKAPHVGASTPVSENEMNCPDVGMLRLDASKEIGWQYAKISGDFNPIHLHPVCAKWFGFKGNIAHGMWSLASAYSALDTHLPEMAANIAKQGVELDTQFIKPWFLPGQGELHYCDRSGNGLDVMLLDEASNLPLFSGRIKALD